MNHPPLTRSLPWLQPGEDFPPTEHAWTDTDPAPGLLAAGGVLDIKTLVSAYRQGIFPWFSEGQPALWWSPDPRMVLPVADFKLHPSLKKQLKTLLKHGRLSIHVDIDFARTIKACAKTPRKGQKGTWIVEDMQRAYLALHHAGHAHSVEAWVDGECWGGLYLTSIGRMVFGESMFSHHSNGSKLALCGLVALCRAQRLPQIDCQQQTEHLSSLGATPWPRDRFVQDLSGLIDGPAPRWEFSPLYWHELLSVKQA